MVMWNFRRRLLAIESQNIFLLLLESLKAGKWQCKCQDPLPCAKNKQRKQSTESTFQTSKLQNFALKDIRTSLHLGKQ